jgi:hypothetical protein
LIFDENLILNESTPGMYSFLCKSTENSKNKFWSSDLLRKGHSLRGQALYKGKKIFFVTWGLWVSKDAEFNVDLKKYELTLVRKCT